VWDVLNTAPVLVSVSEAAKLLGVNADTVRAMCDRHELDYIIGPQGSRLFDPDVVESFKRRHRRQPRRPGVRRYVPVVNDALTR